MNLGSYFMTIKEPSQRGDVLRRQRVSLRDLDLAFLPVHSNLHSSRFDIRKIFDMPIQLIFGELLDRSDTTIKVLAFNMHWTVFVLRPKLKWVRYFNSFGNEDNEWKEKGGGVGEGAPWPRLCCGDLEVGAGKIPSTGRCGGLRCIRLYQYLLRVYLPWSFGGVWAIPYTSTARSH